MIAATRGGGPSRRGNRLGSRNLPPTENLGPQLSLLDLTALGKIPQQPHSELTPAALLARNMRWLPAATIESLDETRSKNV
jgi:hypothetical protein